MASELKEQELNRQQQMFERLEGLERLEEYDSVETPYGEDLDWPNLDGESASSSEVQSET